MKTLILPAYAKINLFLDAVGKRPNGYHEIDSIMQTVDLCDEVEISVGEGEGTEVICSSPFAPSGKDNIAWRAAELYLSENKIKASVKIYVNKNIPSPAGMGGGSADAAAVLNGMNVIFEAMTAEQLELLAMKIGSDVPFCVRGGTQRVGGIGEKLSVCGTMPDCYIVIACSGEDVSTPTAYGELDKAYNSFLSGGNTESPDNILRALGNSDLGLLGKSLYNIFELTVLPYCPMASRAKRILLDNGAIGTLMSGSGSSVFGLFDDFERAQKATDAVKDKNMFATVCRPIAKDAKII